MHPEIRFLLSCLAVASVAPALYYLCCWIGELSWRRQYRRAVAAKEPRVRVSR